MTPLRGFTLLIYSLAIIVSAFQAYNPEGMDIFIEMELEKIDL